MAKKKTKSANRTTSVRRASSPVTRVQSVSMTSFGQLVVAMITFWLANAVILLMANALFPQYVVLGTHLISVFMGAVYASAVTALVAVGAIPLIEYIANQQRIRMSDMHWMVLYWGINTLVIWLVSRFAELIGMGISMWWVAVVLGMVVNVAQGLLMKQVVSKAE